MDKYYGFFNKAGEYTVIRPAIVSDAWGYVYSLDAVCREGIYMLHETSPRSVQDEERLIRILDPSNNIEAVVEIDNVIVGGIGLFKGGHMPKAEHFCNLGLHLIKEARNKGIGDQMMIYATEWAIRADYRKICLTVFSSNRRAIYLYKKHGFIIEGVRKEQYKIGRQYVDEVIMAKFLK